MEFLSTLLIIVFILYVVRVIFRIITPMIFQKVVNNAQQQQRNYQQNYNSTSQPGKIKVDYIPEAKKGSIPDSEGDFVDYEEIK
jgi:hypothetical protein